MSVVLEAGAVAWKLGWTWDLLGIYLGFLPQPPPFPEVT